MVMTPAEIRAMESGLGETRGLANTQRSYTVNDVSIRAASDPTSTLIDFHGHASTWEPYEMYGGPDKGGWVEHVDKGAFKATLGRKADVPFLINHEGLSLARTKAGTLQLAEDGVGLEVKAQLDTRNTEVNNLAVEMERGSVDEMSFAFRVRNQTWLNADGEEVPWWDMSGVERHLSELDLHKGDVSVVNFGANPTTDAALRKLVANMNPDEAHALRGMVALGALAEKRAGMMLSPAAMAVCQSVLDLVNGADDSLDDALEQLSTLMGVTNPDTEDAPDPADSLVGQSSLVHPDLVAAQHRAYARFAAAS